VCVSFRARAWRRSWVDNSREAHPLRRWRRRRRRRRPRRRRRWRRRGGERRRGASTATAGTARLRLRRRPREHGERKREWRQREGRRRRSGRWGAGGVHTDDGCAAGAAAWAAVTERRRGVRSSSVAANGAPLASRRRREAERRRGGEGERGIWNGASAPVQRGVQTGVRGARATARRRRVRLVRLGPGTRRRSSSLVCTQHTFAEGGPRPPRSCLPPTTDAGRRRSLARRARVGVALTLAVIMTASNMARMASPGPLAASARRIGGPCELRVG
jgi:hypothetical protein